LSAPARASRRRSSKLAPVIEPAALAPPLKLATVKRLPPSELMRKSSAPEVPTISRMSLPAPPSTVPRAKST